jgi:hypothetical protein
MARRAELGVAVLVLLATVAPCGAQATAGAATTPRRLSLGLDVLRSPHYAAQRELRLGLWDSPMSRLEFSVARELRAARNPGPTGMVAPMSRIELPLRLSFTNGAPGGLLFGPWSPGWRELEFSEKVAYTAQTAVFLGILAQAIHHIK